MIGRSIFFIILLIGAGTVPYLMSDKEWIAKIEEFIGKHKNDTTDNDSAAAPSPGLTKPISVYKPPAFPKFALPNAASTAEIVPPNNASFELPLPHVLSFEATPEWIRSNWDRVTNRVGELDLQGWRVPYFRSLPNDDFAGSVTYYFDRARLVQRILLHGYTSDASEMVQLATSHYGMRRVHSPEGDLYVATLDGKPIGALQVRYSPILDAKRKPKQCEVLLELNRRETEYGMSYEFSQRIEKNRDANYLLTPMHNAVN